MLQQLFYGIHQIEEPCQHPASPRFLILYSMREQESFTRRFGKTLNMSMLNCFFSLQYQNRGDLFEGLSVWSAPVFLYNRKLRLIIGNRNQSNVLHNGLMFSKMRKCYDVIMKNAYMPA